ncbi:MAG: serine hydrolase domain-containing protein, partial [Kofleriaceae bacterium]
MKRWIALALAGCGHPTTTPAELPDAALAADAAAPAVLYPDPDWPTGTPESVGLDPGKLDAAAAAADDTDSYCLLVIRHGVLVSEHYFHDATAATTPNSWSIAKSYTSTTVGIALGIELDVPASTFVPSWQADARATITLRDLVTMTSGLSWSIFSDYITMAELAPDKSAYAIGLDAHDPAGSQWLYHNGGVQVIEPLFRA